MKRMAGIAAAGIALGVGCSDPEGPTLRFMRWADPLEIEATERLITVFEESHPGVDVQLIPTNWAEYWTKLQATLAAGDAPDVFLMDGASLLDHVRDGTLLDLTPHAERTGFGLAGFYEHPVGLFRRGGRLWGLPRDCNTVGIYINLSMLEEAGISVPGPDWTWGEFLETAEGATRDLDGDGTIDQWGYLVSPGSQETGFTPWIWSAGGTLLDAEGRHATLDTPEVRSAIGFLHGLIHSERVAPDLEGDATDDYQLFLTGRLAMYSGGSWMMRPFRQIEGFEWDVLPVPRGAAGSITSVNGLGHVVWADTQQPELAWELVAFLSSDVAQESFALDGSSIPALRRVAESPAFLRRDVPPAHPEHFIHALETAKPLEFTRRYSEWDEALRRQIERAFRGDITVEEALTLAQRDVQEILDEVWAEDDAQPPHP